MNNVMLGMIGIWEIGIILLILLVMAGLAVGVVLLVVWLVRRNQTPPSTPANPPTPRPTPPPPTSANCPRCDATLPPESPQGLCPRCVLGVGLDTQTEATGEFGPHGTKIVSPPEAEVAKRFPHLEILGCLGHGGMGVVYKARQPKLNRFVALKILAPEKGADPKFAERFLREAQALARLSHPNIVTVHDFGEADGMFFLLMEFVDGMTLRQLLREGLMKPEQALAIVPPICEALQFAHEQGVVHRDIKPENVLLDKQGRVKIADFGIAKLVGTAGREGSPLPAGATQPEGGAHGVTRPTVHLTQDQVLGTPHYMAPEQVEKPQLVDHRADIYSLGVVFYEMLTGELPLGKFQPPSKKVQVDVRLDEVVLHALEKEPARRYQHASEVKSDVETIATTPRVDNPVGPGEPASAEVGTFQAHSANKSAAAQLKAPAWGLFASGILQLVVFLSLVVFAIPAVAREGGGSAGVAVVGGMAGLSLLAALVVLAGVRAMLRLQQRGLAVAACGVAMIAGPAALLGLPFGLWALMVLSRREVESAFAWVDGRPATQGERSLASPVPAGGVWKIAAIIAGAVIILMLAPPALYLLLGRWPPVSAEGVVRVEDKLRSAILDRLAEGDWRPEGLSVSVAPNLKRAECRFGKVRKHGLTQEPFNAAIRLTPQGGGLWLVRGEGEFQSVRFSVDTSAEMASRQGPGGAQPGVFQYSEPEEASSAGSLTQSLPRFGPVRELTLNHCVDDSPGGEALDLDRGELLDLPKQFERLPEPEQTQWLRDQGADLLLLFDRAQGRWGLITVAGNELKLALLPVEKWDTAKPEDMSQSSVAESIGLETRQRGEFRVYLFGANQHPPLTFAFHTARGARGLLQITSFTEQPDSARIRFKLVRSTAP